MKTKTNIQNAYAFKSDDGKNQNYPISKNAYALKSDDGEKPELSKIQSPQNFQ